MTKRLQVDMSDEDYAKLRKLAKGSPLVDLVRRALSMEAFLQEQEAKGAHFLVEYSDGTTSRILRV